MAAQNHVNWMAANANMKGRETSLTTLFRAVVSVEGLFLALLLPAVLLMRPAVVPVLLLIPLLWGARRVATGHFVPPTPLDWSLAALLVMVMVSLYATFDLALSLPKVAGVLYGVAVFYALVDAVGDSERRLWAAVALFIVAGLGVAAVGVFATQWSTKVPILVGLTARLPALLSVVNPNEVAGVLLWMTPLAVAVAVAAVARMVRRGRWWAAGGLALGTGLPALAMLGVLILTQSRSGWLGLTAGVGLMALAAVNYYRRSLAPLFGVLVLIGAGVALAGPQELGDGLFVGGAVGGEIADQALNSLAGRREIWSRAVYGLQDFAFTGMGMGTFRRAVHILYPLFLIGPETDIAHAHNHLLQTGLDLGLPGLVAYLALWLGAARLLWGSWRRTGAVRLRALDVGLGGSLFAYFIYGLTDAVALGARPGFLFWYLLALVAASFRVAASR